MQRSALQSRAVQMSGQHYRVQQEPSVPPGVKPPPVLVAALGPQMLRLAGRPARRHSLGCAAMDLV
ncbi:MAG TPA: LLM class flavin-dependent oxidoreductase [Mycobacterium sp.]